MPIVQQATATSSTLGLNDRGAFSLTEIYLEGDVVEYQGTHYIAKQRITGHAPTGAQDDPYWKALSKNQFTYTLVVDVPVPFLALNLNLDLVGAFILPALSALGVPQAVSWFLTNAKDYLQNVIDDAMFLIRAIPEAAVLIIVRVGGVVIVNIQLVAEKVPFIVPVPTFVLDLPNFAVDLDFVLKIPFPTPPPIIQRVPIPVPIIALPETPVVITGGQVSASAQAVAAVDPVPVENPVSLPTI
jgi:hypothetical protein